MGKKLRDVEGLFVREIKNFKKLKRQSVFYYLNDDEIFIGYLN